MHPYYNIHQLYYARGSSAHRQYETWVEMQLGFVALAVSALHETFLSVPVPRSRPWSYFLAGFWLLLSSILQAPPGSRRSAQNLPWC
jgi:hypothetical protein